MTRADVVGVAGPALPPSWRWRALGDIVENLDRRRVPVNRREREQRRGRVPYFGATGQVGWIDQPLFNEDVVLLGEDGVQFLDPSARKAYRVTGPSWVNNHAHVLRPVRDQVSDGYLCHVLNAISYRGHVNGTTRLKLTQRQMNELPIPLAPRAEQDAIVAAIEEEFARIDAIESEFDAVDRLEAQLRNALYRDAFRGRPSRAMDELSAEGPWPTSPLSGVATVLRGVTFKKGEASDTPGDGLVPVLRSGNVQESLVTDSRLLFLPMSAIKTEQMLSQGDLVVSVSNSLELVGKSAPLVDTWQGSFGAFLSVVRPGPQLRPGFLAHYARSSSWRSSVAEVATATSNIANINLSKLKALQIPLPSLGMQDHVVEAIEAELPRLAHVRDLTAGGRLDLDRLRQSILHRAFAGALLPSNPDASPESPTVTAP